MVQTKSVFYIYIYIYIYIAVYIYIYISGLNKSWMSGQPSD